MVEPARPVVVREHRYAAWFAVATVCFGAFMGQLDASIVTLAFPAVQREFGVRLAAAQWVSLGYLLVLVALLVPVGRWSDRAGRKLIYLYGFVVFTGASAACGLAGSLWMLVTFRLVQATGAAMLQANSVALVATSVAAGRRRAALGVQAAAQAVGLALGPIVGGVLVASVGWRWVFWINVPVGVLALVAGWFLLPRTRERADHAPLDVGGVGLLAVSSAALLLALSSAAGLSLGAVAVASLVAVAVAAGVGLIAWERRCREPLMDPAVLGRPGVRSGLVGALVAYLVLFGPLVLFPQIAAGDKGVLAAGLMLTALPAGFGIAAVGADRVLPRLWSDRRRCVSGALVAAAGAGVLVLPLSGRWQVLALGVLGVGLGVFIPANNASIMAAIPGRMEATAGGMVNMARGLGTAGGVAAVSVALHLSTAAGGAGAARRAAGMAVLALAAVAMVVISRAASPVPHQPGGGAR